MTEIKTYKGHTISVNQDGKFIVLINGRMHRFASLKSAENAIDKTAVVDFKPTECFMIENKGYNPSVYSIKKVKLVGYEEKKFSRGWLRRYFKTDKDEMIDMKHENFFALKELPKVTEYIKEANRLEKLRVQSEKDLEKLTEKWKGLAMDIDPRPEADQ